MKEKRDKVIKVRLTQTEYNKLINYTKIYGLNMSELIRKMLFCGHREKKTFF